MQGSLAVFRFHFVARRHFQGLSSPIAVSCVREAPMAFENREKSVSRVPVEQPPADEGRRGELPVANTPSVGRDEPGRALPRRRTSAPGMPYGGGTSPARMCGTRVAMPWKPPWTT